MRNINKKTEDNSKIAYWPIGKGGEKSLGLTEMSYLTFKQTQGK